ncbi:MAG: hypothetical protein FJ139_10935 [Deltaproteobacteria bacterium]|nr:hypothetical protein [Deltaproteobacteria bacterium]
MDKTIRTTVFSIILMIGLFTTYTMYVQKEKNLTVEVLMTSWHSGSIAMYVDTGEGFNEKLSVRRSYIGDGTPHKYSLSLHISRDIHALRLDPIDATGKIEIREIAVTWQGMVYRYTGNDLNRWRRETGLMLIDLSLHHSFLKELLSFLRDKIALLIWLLLFLILATGEHSWTLSEGEISRKTLFIHFFAGGIPIILLWTLYHETLETWWLIDDPCHLFYVSQNGIFAAFYDRSRLFSPINFNPMLPFSFGLDYLFAGLNPRPFYWHHLLSFTLTLTAGYALFVRFFPPVVSSIILSSFVASLPVCDSTFHLMVRHYVEGLFFTFISVIFFLAALRKEKFAYHWIGALFYLLACISKELYVPLIVLFAVFLLKRDRHDFKMLYPYAAAAVIYFLWRFYMLGIEGMASAYPHIPVKLENILNAPLLFVTIMGWTNPWHISLIAIATLLFCITFAKGSWRYKLITITLIAGCIAPIIPVLGMFSSRYVFALSLIVFMGTGIGIQHLYTLGKRLRAGHAPALLLGAALILGGCLSTEQGIAKWKHYSDEIKAEGNFLLFNNDPHNLLITEHGHCYWAFSSIRKAILNMPQGPSFCKSDCICFFLHPDKKVWINVDGQLYQAGATGNKKTPEECGDKGDLDVNIHYSRGILKWKFGPHKEGRYLVFIKGWDSGMLQVKSDVELPYNINFKDDFIIVKYESPRGWSVYSPVLTFTQKGDGEGSIIWRSMSLKSPES